MRLERAERKVRLKEKRYEREQLMKEKRSEELAAFEEVFDRSTLTILYGMLNRGELARIHGVVDAGKEARIYLGEVPREAKVAVKIYLVTTAEFVRGRIPYIEGDPRFRRVRRDTRSLVYLWAQKEFKNLQTCHLASVPVPKPILVRGNVLLMQFIGSDGNPAPLLKDVELDDPETTYRSLLRMILKLYTKAHLVHGDLSEYNIMMWGGRPILFDVSQAVHVEHPMAQLLLKRDLENINNYFERYSIKLVPVESTYSTAVKSAAD